MRLRSLSPRFSPCEKSAHRKKCRMDFSGSLKINRDEKRYDVVAISGKSLSISPLRLHVFTRPGLRGETLWGGDEGMAPSLLSNQPMERPMQRNDLSRSLVAFDQNSTLVAVVALSL